MSNLQNERFHFAFLDSANDRDVIFREFLLLIPRMIEGGLIMIDDAGISADGQSIDASVEAQKGHRVWQFLWSNRIQFSVLETPQGHGRQLRLDLSSENLSRIMGNSRDILQRQ